MLSYMHASFCSWTDGPDFAVWRWLSSVTPLGYAFEALLINEFSDTNGERPYRIEGSVSLFAFAGGSVPIRSAKPRVPFS